MSRNLKFLLPTLAAIVFGGVLLSGCHSSDDSKDQPGSAPAARVSQPDGTVTKKGNSGMEAPK